VPEWTFYSETVFIYVHDSLAFLISIPYSDEVPIKVNFVVTQGPRLVQLRLGNVYAHPYFQDKGAVRKKVWQQVK
jgi:hypothetical protein